MVNTDFGIQFEDEPAPAPAPAKNRGGRPKGSKNKPKIMARAPVHEPVHEPRRIRHKDPEGKFAIPDEFKIKLRNRSIEWKRHTLLGQQDPAYEMELKRKGWLPVQSHMMPGMMPPGYKGPIVRDGMMLYERPQELTDEARHEAITEAFEVIRTTEKRLGIASPGEATRDHPDAQPRIVKTYEPLIRKG